MGESHQSTRPDQTPLERTLTEYASGEVHAERLKLYQAGKPYRSEE